MKSRYGILLAILAFAGLAAPANAVDLLGSAASFAVLGGETVTNTGPTVLSGDLGVAPGDAITGFPPGIANGTIYVDDAVAMQAQSDVTVAYNTLAGMPPTQDLTGQDLGGLTLTPGVYFFASSAQLTGPLTLDAQNNPDALFVFRIGTTLTTASSSSVVVINGVNACNVYWQIGSSATLGTTTAFKGNILALASITLNAGATIVDGRALARTGAVTLDTNVITAAQCEAPPVPIGACCLPDGSCQVALALECQAAGGVYQGDGVSCAEANCPQPAGACCLPNGNCVGALPEDACTAQGGLSYPGLTCGDVNCVIAVEPESWGGIKGLYR